MESGAIVVVAAALALAACVPHPNPPSVEPAPRLPPITGGPFQGLDPGASQADSLHFRVYAYGPDVARQVADEAEAAYSRIMVDTDLFSFRPRELYHIYVYGSPDEFRKKTGQPNWSGGLSIGNSIYSYYGPSLIPTIAHEMTHLIFYEFMGGVNLSHRWINEGLAVYQENKAVGILAGRSDIFAAVRGQVRRAPLPMAQMINLVPSNEREYMVNTWYAQAESMVRFMIERGGRIGFSQFLAALKDGRSANEAIGRAYPTVWRGLDDFELSWQRSLQ
ncbi:MAG: hypothetical protein HY549_12990 [Elusimicrobia bacterium]|nr:hypothetical protein [Elusimicrobiota bacterium]